MLSKKEVLEIRDLPDLKDVKYLITDWLEHDKKIKELVTNYAALAIELNTTQVNSLELQRLLEAEKVKRTKDAGRVS